MPRIIQRGMRKPSRATGRIPTGSTPILPHLQWFHKSYNKYTTSPVQRKCQEIEYDLVNGFTDAILDEQKQQQAWGQMTGEQQMQRSNNLLRDALKPHIPSNIPPSLRDLMVSTSGVRKTRFDRGEQKRILSDGYTDCEL
ncbi:hypothetical protein ACFSND_27970 [Brevibacillus brevis]|uniref:hypothetical protein n=1 Tax=Brevibacillus brevis TaxID=1393 RepID=UPI00363C30BB